MGDATPSDPGSGLRDESPRVSGIGLATGAGGLWGLVGYTALWQGTPFSVDRRFVGSVLGTVILLPIRLVLWGIRGAEVLTGRTYSFPDATWWIGLVASALGAGIAVGGFLAARSVVRRARGDRVDPDRTP